MKVPENYTLVAFGTSQLTKLSIDGIHVDMDRLKKGEVKYELFPYHLTHY